MHRRNVLLSCAMLTFAVALPGLASSQGKSLKEQLVGTWTLSSWEITRTDGSKAHDFGSDPKGLAMFGPDGRFAVVFTKPDLPKLSANNRQNATAEEAKAILAGSLAYYGTYTVDEPSKTINFKIESSTFPNQLNVEQKRVITSITADELKYGNPAATSGGRTEITMKRAK